MKRILASLALLTLTTSLAHSMVGEFREAGKRLASVVIRNHSSLTGTYSETQLALTPKLLRAFSSAPKEDIYALKRQTSDLFKQKLKLDNDTMNATRAFEETPANRIDRKLIDSYIKELLQQNVENCKVIQELNSLLPEKKATPICTAVGSGNGC